MYRDGTVDGAPGEGLRIGTGPKAHEQHGFRVGDRVTGLAVLVPDRCEKRVTHYKVSPLKLQGRGPLGQDMPANREGGVALALPEYRSRGHRCLDKQTYSASCQRCPEGSLP